MAVTPVGQSSSTSTTSILNNKILGKDDFLKMFVTQLKHQDPLSPMQNEQFAAQLASFSQLESLQNMNTLMQQSLDSNMIMTQSINNSLATTLIGKNVKTSGSDFVYEKGDASKLNFSLDKNAASVFVKIYNEKGDLVKTIEKYNVEKGEKTFEWDGKTDVGSEAGNGNYNYKVVALDEKNQAINATSYQVLKITGVKYMQGSAYILAGDNTVKLSEILEILQ